MPSLANDPSDRSDPPPWWSLAAGQAAVGAVLAAVGLIALTLALSAALADTAPRVWERPAAVRAEARRGAIRTAGGFEPRWDQGTGAGPSGQVR